MPEQFYKIGDDVTVLDDARAAERRAELENRSGRLSGAEAAELSALRAGPMEGPGPEEYRELARQYTSGELGTRARTRSVFFTGPDQGTDGGPYSPQARAAFLAGQTQQERRQSWERTAAPPLTGELHIDLAAADNAIARAEAAWQQADIEWRSLQAAAGDFPSPEQFAEITAARRRESELWEMRQRAIALRDRLEGQARTAARPDLDLPPGEDRY